MRPVIFDLDGVLIDSEPYYELALSGYLREIGLSDQPGLFALTVGRRTVDFLPELARRLDRREVEIKRGLERALAPHLEAISARAGAWEAVWSLHDDGRPLALATSSDASPVTGLLRRLGLIDAFDAIVTGEDVEDGKPDPAIYRLAATRLSADPTTCIAVEDTPVGVASAVGAGMFCIALTNSVADASELSRASALASDLEHVARQIRALG